MDGTLLDTERLGRIYWQKAGRELGWEISDEVFSSMIGKNLQNNEEDLKKTLGLNFPFKEIHQKRVELGLKENEIEQVKLKPGAREALERVSTGQLKIALATSTAKEKAEKKLKKVEIYNFFDAFVFGDEITRGKPEPEIFLRAASLLELDIKNCLVIEDSEAGIKAAHASGAIPVYVPDIQVISESIKELVTHQLKSLNELEQIILS